MRYFFGFLITIGLLILVIVLLIRSGPSGNPEAPKSTKALSSYATTDSELIFTNSGPVNAVSLHREIRITVDSDKVTYEVLSGYSGNVIKTARFTNTEDAYENFLRALGHAGFTKGDADPALANEQGFCPLNHRYVFKLNNEGEEIQRYWSTDCGSPKTYLGNSSLTIDLFEMQVPEYDTMSQNVFST